MADVESVPKIILFQELDELKATIIQNHIAAGQVASGRTMKSLRIDVSENEGKLFFVGNHPFGVLETGRRAGKIPRQFYLIIEKWMIAKGIQAPPIPYVRKGKHKYTPQERGRKAMAAAIALSIKKKGTKLFQNKGRNDIYSKPIEATMKRITERLSMFITQKINHIKLNTTEVIK